MKRKRLIYRVKFHRRVGLWYIQRPTGRYFWYRNKKITVAHARAFARDRWEHEGRLSQLVVHKQDGRIQFENTYGRDPERSKG